MRFLGLIAAFAYAVAPAAVPPQPTVELSPAEASVAIGQTVALESVVRQQAGTTGGIAHLNVTSLDGVYVDLEDWAHDVTQPVPSTAEATLDWEVQAVNPGRFALYVVLVPRSGALVVSPRMTVTVAARQTLNTGGALPVAVAVPLVLGLIAVVTRFRPAG